MNITTQGVPFPATAALNETLRHWIEWSEAHSEATATELWAAYGEQGRMSLINVPPLWLSLRVHPAWRKRASLALCRAALARLELQIWPQPAEGREEAHLWEMALAISPRAVKEWQVEWPDFAKDEGIYNVHYRLADLARRAARHDGAALTLYIENFYGNAALPWARHSPGGYHDPAQLLERGARIDNAVLQNPAELNRRYGFCLRLRLLNYSAGWVATSLALAQQNLALAQQNKAVKTASSAATHKKLAFPSADLKTVAKSFSFDAAHETLSENEKPHG
jgi:hypothetical protein